MAIPETSNPIHIPESFRSVSNFLNYFVGERKKTDSSWILIF